MEGDSRGCSKQVLRGCKWNGREGRSSKGGEFNISKITGLRGICRVYISLNCLRVERWEISSIGTG